MRRLTLSLKLARGSFIGVGNVSKRLAVYLGCGSLPGALIGVLVLNELRADWGSEINSFLVRFIGALLVCISFLLLSQGRIERFFNLQRRPPRQIIPKLIGIACCPVFWWE